MKAIKDEIAEGVDSTFRDDLWKSAQYGLNYGDACWLLLYFEFVWDMMEDSPVKP